MRRLVLIALVLVACKKTEDPAAKPQPGATKTANDPCAKAHVEGPLTWIHDDYAAALACAKHKKVPLVLDLWAPWCHTCLSMQSTVFMDASFKAAATKFVFAALDTDREVNAAAVDKFPLSAWPTFYVVGHDETVLARFVGAASVAQFHAFLDAGTRAMAGGAVGPDEHLLNAERAVAAKDLAKAETELTAALAAAPPAWPRRADALVTLIHTKSKRRDLAGCLDVAEQNLDATGNAASASDFMSHAMGCASDLLAKDKTAAERVTKLRERAIVRWQALVADKATPMSVDDRSDVMMYLREALIAVDRKPEAKQVAEAQRAMLDEAAAKASDPMHAMTYNWPRAEVYVYLEKPLELVPALEKSAADLPKEYDPLARLGWIYLKAGKLEDAVKYTDKALALVYGPRKVRVLNQRAEIAVKQNDPATERAMREQIVKLYESMPVGHANPDALAKAKQALADFDAKQAAGSGSGSGK
jgi:thioredoxin-like negative regulator of GroEL